jgi:hypothetical protein
VNYESESCNNYVALAAVIVLVSMEMVLMLVNKQLLPHIFMLFVVMIVVLLRLIYEFTGFRDLLFKRTRRLVYWFRPLW